MSYDVIRYSPELKPAVLELLRHAWGPDTARNAACFAWKLEQNPYLDRPLLHLVTRDREVVGMRALHGVRWLRGPDGPPLSALSTGDFVVHPDHRGRHLFGRLLGAAVADARALGYRHLLNLSAGPATYLQSIRAGWQDLGDLGRLQRGSLRIESLRWTGRLLKRHRALTGTARRLRGYLENLARYGPKTAEKRFRRLERVVGRRADSALSGLSISAEPRSAAMADLCDRGESDGRLRHVRDAAYLAWRFRNPLSCYRFLYRDETGLDGCLVLETPVDPFQECVRVVLCEARTPELHATMLRAAVEHGGFADLRLWSSSAQPTERSWLAAAGFREIGPPPPARYRHALLALDLDSGAGDPLPPLAGWRVSMIDSDKC